VAASLGAIAERLFAGVMAPLVLGGAMRPGHAIGSRSALGLGDGRAPVDRVLATLVDVARVRYARRLAPVDTLPGPTKSEWALAAALHDLLQAANPIFDYALRRAAAETILRYANETIEHVAPPASVGEALTRHSWFGRVMEVTRADTRVSWWAGYRTFRGVAPPPRLQRWARLRRVRVTRTPVGIVDLHPIAVESEDLGAVVQALLARTPLTDLATCTRDAPVFVWQPGALSLLATQGGRKLALRALARLDAARVDIVLERATRGLLEGETRSIAEPAVALVRERALADGYYRARAEGPYPRRS